MHSSCCMVFQTSDANAQKRTQQGFQDAATQEMLASHSTQNQQASAAWPQPFLMYTMNVLGRAWGNPNLLELRSLWLTVYPAHAAASRARPGEGGASAASRAGAPDGFLTEEGSKG